MNSLVFNSFFGALKGLFTSRKFLAQLGAAIFSTIVVVVSNTLNNQYGWHIEPNTIIVMVLGIFGGSSSYAIATGLEEKGKGAVIAQTAADIALSPAMDQLSSTTSSLDSAPKVLASIGGGSFVDFGITIGVQAFLSAIKGPKKKLAMKKTAAMVVKETLDVYGNDPEFLQMAGLSE